MGTYRCLHKVFCMCIYVYTDIYIYICIHTYDMKKHNVPIDFSDESCYNQGGSQGQHEVVTVVTPFSARGWCSFFPPSKLSVAARHQSHAKCQLVRVVIKESAHHMSP